MFILAVKSAFWQLSIMTFEISYLLGLGTSLKNILSERHQQDTVVQLPVSNHNRQWGLVGTY